MLKSVLVTGAAGGIGLGLIEALSAAGWSVLATDKPDKCPPKHIANRCHAWLPADLAAFGHDSGQLKVMKSSILSLTEGVGPVAIVHNAALQRIGLFSQLTAPDWHETMAVNLIAPVLISRALLPQLRKHRGSIVHIGSIHSYLTKPGFTAYATSKAALAGLTRSMAVELGGSVRVNAIEPAAITTPMLEAGFIDTPELKDQLGAFHPTGSIGSPADVARAVLFLLDPLNTFINGCVLPLDGGIRSRLYDPA